MKPGTLLCAAIITGLSSGLARAAITANNSTDLSLPGVTQNNWAVDTDADFTNAVLAVDLTIGTVHDPFTFLGVEVDGNIFSPGSGDTFVAANDSTAVVGCPALCAAVFPSPFDTILGPTMLRIAWTSPFADTDDIGTGLPIGRFSFTSDAVGTWQLLVNNAADDQALITGVVVNGAMVPEPASLGLLSLGGLALLRRKR
jgi:PEP-CTERM motif